MDEGRAGREEGQGGGKGTPKTTTTFAFYPSKPGKEGGSEGGKEGGREATKRFLRSLDIYGLRAEGGKEDEKGKEEGLDMGEEKQMYLLGSRGG